MAHKVPAFVGWPPMFMNQATKGVLQIDESGNVVVASDIIDTVVRNAQGDYTITLTRPVPGIPLSQCGSSNPRITSIFPSDGGVGQVWQLYIWDDAGAAQDAYVGIFFTQLRIPSWIAPAPL